MSCHACSVWKCSVLPKRHINQRRNTRNPFKFDFHAEPHATIYKPRCCLCDFVFFRPRRPIVIKHDCQSTAHEERTERRNSYLKENFFKIGSFKSKEKCKNRTPRSVRMSCVLRLEMQRAPEASHQSAAQQAKSFQMRFSRRAARDHLQALLLLV